MCDANESVTINQHNLFEYYANYIGNLPFGKPAQITHLNVFIYVAHRKKNERTKKNIKTIEEICVSLCDLYKFI